MDFQLKPLTIAQAAAEKSDVLIVLVGSAPIASKDSLSVLAASARKAGDLPDKAGKLLSLYRPDDVVASRVVLAAIGDGKPASVRSGVIAAVNAAKAHRPKRAVVVFAQPADGAAVASAVTAAADASYVYTTTKPKAEARSIRHLTVGVADAAGSNKAFDEARATVLGIELAKEWGNRPANHATPTLLAEAAKELGRLSNIKCEVLGPKEVEKLGMGSFAAVAQGSSEPLRFIVLRYQGAPKDQAPVVLVGKGITFDTGGVSLKPAAEMDEMKFDMCGAASVLGTFRALGEIQPAINVVGLIPSCENMNDGKAVKPGDVVTSMSGQTIEVLNTDAEGRLILCDALTYAKRFEPAAVIDIATLTGACVIALGGVRSGLFASDETLAGALQAAGEQSQDRCWRLPLDDDYAEGLKSNFADVANIGGRAGGAVVAAKFLQRFVGDFPWAHLDIAGTAWKSGAAKGSTGRPVGLLVSYLTTRAADKAATAPPKAKTKAEPKAPARKAKSPK
ncbi:leucyl aminopeptidase [Variovorax boronicumulans]|uniref:Probable cytosol aminopeptidase n=1 Tax=Variovorax boronicumulans TaxID=436515 RepID=A0AAW8CT06_9BURK|nr:leucyl aminopeptidase [Variovorax boronicumulans]MDP9891034.1 leucyl aminopeptidase [Variovorax boronicumulans]MDQ0041229.1 leucyl aminopeptidase [Variovorax boronicumulans]MDQ0051101.1 leucyl aminopeptidase [Variovorax boronicumulans]